jgi:hypothetical protein
MESPLFITPFSDLLIGFGGQWFGGLHLMNLLRDGLQKGGHPVMSISEK